MSSKVDEHRRRCEALNDLPDADRRRYLLLGVQASFMLDMAQDYREHAQCLERDAQALKKMQEEIVAPGSVNDIRNRLGNWDRLNNRNEE